MMRISGIVWLLATLASTARAAGDAHPASTYFVLENGLQVLLQEKHGLPLTGMTLAIDLGSKDETDATSGYAHLLEHMLLFGAGTDSEARLAEFRGHGVEYNAHTDHDLMTFEVSCPAGESAWALEQMRRAVFAGRLDPVLLEREKRIIAEEILQLRDDPDSLGQLLIVEQLFAGHPYGRPVCGDGSAIQSATVEQLQAFCAPRLTPECCALAVIGDFSLAEMEGEVRRSWGGMAKGASPAVSMPAAGRLEKNSERQVELDIQKSHLFIGWRGPAFNDTQRLPFSLLTHLLGRGLNPILGGILRSGRQLVEQMDMSYFPMGLGGMTLLHVTLEARNIRSVRNEVASFLSRIGSFNFSRNDVLPQNRMGMVDYLESARNQMAYNDGSFRESTRNLATACARFLLLNRNPVKGSYLESVESVSSSDLRRVAGKFLSGKKWAVLAITPLNRKAK